MPSQQKTKVAYLINQYPAISHSFIRREVQALERAGVSIHRYAIRPSAQGVLSPEDQAEAERTQTIIGSSLGALAGGILSGLAATPVRAARALGRALAMGWRSEAGLLRHLFYWAEALVIANWMRRDGVFHVHAHFGTNSATVAMLAAMLRGGTFSMTVHGPEEFDKPGLISLKEKIQSCAFVAGVSSFGASQLKRLVTPDYWDRIKIVHCGIEKAFYAPASSAPGGETRPPRFVCVGRLCEQKGQVTLIEAAALVKQSGRSFEVELVGDGDMRSVIEAAVARYQLKDEIQFAGWKTPSQVRAAIEGARAFVLPSFAEGLPVSIMEALSLKRPVIATYIAGIPELVQPGVNGWLTPAGDVEALAAAMMAALDADDETLKAMGEAGKERVVARHDSDQIAGQLRDLFTAIGAPRETSPAPSPHDAIAKETTP